MSTSSSNYSEDPTGSTAGFNVAPGSSQASPMMDFNVLKNWMPQAMQALRKSNIRTQMVNPPPDATPQGSGVAKGLISSLL